jgi:hypothetical protein
MSYQDEIAQRIRPFSEFSRIMTQLPSLDKMECKQREDLLHELYRLAAGKAIRARWAEQQWRSIAKLREQRREIAKVGTLFRKIAKDLEDAHKSFRGSILEVEDAYVGRVFRPAIPGRDKEGVAAQTTQSLSSRANNDACRGLPVALVARQVTVAERIAKDLRSLADEATHVQERNATRIPPSRRINSEKQLASQYPAGIRADLDPYPPIGPRTRAIHHWLIGEAASCLERFQSKKDPKFNLRGKLIAQLLVAAFDDSSINEESIKKELRRQREHGRPQYNLHTWR